MLRADDMNSTFANGANMLNALTNVNEAHSADLARKKQAAMDRLRFDTEIGAVERQRQMELLKKYDDDSIFGGIKELAGAYKTDNPIVANAGAGNFDGQINALTGTTPQSKEETLLSKLTGLGEGSSYDKQRTAQLSRDIRSDHIQPKESEGLDLVADQKTIDKWGDRLGVDRKSSARRQLVKDVKAKVARDKAYLKGLSGGMSDANSIADERPIDTNKQTGIKRGDVKSYLQKAYSDGSYVSEFKGSYSDMDSQNLNMYKPLVDEAIANRDWKAADMLNRQYMANKRSIDKSWGEKGGRGGVDSLYSGPPKRKAEEKTIDTPITVTNKSGQKMSVNIRIPIRMLKNLHSKETLDYIYDAANMSPEWDVRNGNAWFVRASNKDLEYDIFRRQDEEYARAQEDLQHGYGKALGDRSGGIVTANGKVVYPAIKPQEAGLSE